MTRPARSRVCGHCQQEIRDPSSGQLNETPLCHPDEGPDCYHLVTVYRHPMPCPDCPGQVGMRALQDVLNLNVWWPEEGP